MQKNELGMEWARLSEASDLQALRRFLCILSPCMNDYLFLYDVKRDLLTVSPKAVERFCMPSSEFSDTTRALEAFVHKDDLPVLLTDLEDLFTSQRTTHDLLYRMISTDGKPVWVNGQGRLVRDEQGEPLYMAGCINEVGRDQRGDNQTGLLGASELRRVLAEQPDPLPDGFFLRFNLDDFSTLVARLGSARGDEIISVLSALVLDSLRPQQLLFRLVGDEFMVVDLCGGTLEEADALYNEVRAKLSRSIAQSDYRVPVTLSAGAVSCADVDGHTLSAVMSRTSFAVANAKRAGKNRCYLYDALDFERFDKNRTLHSLLIEAVENDFAGFEVYYQLLYSSGKKSIIGAEALLRFHTEAYGTVSPLEIIPILEEHGLIIPVGRWVLRQACLACLRFQKQVPDFHMSVNISPVQVQRSPFWQDLNEIIAETGVDPSSIVCELTESERLENDARMVALSRRLRDSNIQLALDDFGTGYSNFRYLPDLMPNLIKIDRTFTAKAARDPYEFKLLSMFSEMAHTLGIEIVIEGVENEEELETARLVSADYIQGYYYGRPEPFDRVSDTLAGVAPASVGPARFPSLLLDRHFVASVTTGPYAYICWVNVQTGDLKTYKRRGPINFLCDTLPELIDAVIERGLVHPGDVNELRASTNFDYIRSTFRSDTRKIACKLRMKVGRVYEWVLMELTAPNTYSDDFPFVLLAWRSADRFFCLQEEALRMLNRNFYKVSMANLTQNTITELKDSDSGGWVTELHPVPLDSGLVCVCDNGNIHPEDMTAYRRFVDVSTLSARFSEGEKRLMLRFRRRIDGKFRWVQLEIVPAMDYSPDNQQVMFFVQDIHEDYLAEIASQQEMQRLANTDPLTGLYNRHHFNEFREEFDRFYTGRPAGFLYADLNDLKHVNDTQGHEQGDRFIQRFAERLRQCFPGDGCVRMSGDEFAVCLTDMQQDEWQRRVEALREAIQTPDGPPIAAIGEIWTAECGTITELMNEAERRMYENKKAYKPA